MKIIAFTGLKQAGKDTAAHQLKLSLIPARVKQINFADALKKEVAAACNTTVDDINTRKASYRTLLQVWGTDYRRMLHGENYWLLKWVEAVNALSPIPQYLLCTDVRFLNEAAIIKQLGGVIIRIVKSSLKADGHASETEQAHIVADFTVHNDGDINELRQQINKLKL